MDIIKKEKVGKVSKSILPFVGLTEFDEDGYAVVESGKGQLIADSVEGIVFKGNSEEIQVKTKKIETESPEKKKAKESVQKLKEVEHVKEPEKTEDEVITSETVIKEEVTELSEAAKTLIESIKSKDVKELTLLAKNYSEGAKVSESEWNELGEDELKSYLISKITG